MPEARRRIGGFALLIALYLVIVYGIPKPEAVSPAGWRLFGLFVASVAGLVVEPIPGGAIVLIAVTLTPSSADLLWLKRYPVMPTRQSGLSWRRSHLASAHQYRTGAAHCPHLRAIVRRQFARRVLRLIDVRHGTRHHHPVVWRAIGWRSPPDRALHRGLIRLAAGTDRKAARLVSDDLGLRIVAISCAHVLHWPAEQSVGRQDGSSNWIPRDLGELVYGGHRSGPLLDWALTPGSS